MTGADMPLVAIQKIAEQLRAAIFSVEPAARHASLKNFPHASCGSTSELIGSYLEEKGFGRFEYLHGSREGIPSHAWIQQGDLIVDLTADQFPGIDEAVIVSRCSQWHAQFEVSNPYKIDIAASDEGALRPLQPFYEQLQRLLG
ncbi:hypothetical protein D3879_04280 [Pseudomonas cavernicola]|uniref:Microcin J25-processing protein McjB C-terminal domain-containing protein n=1 Tax=Pseudomonas cavernicola TaxID=2320866 RepID=A0A418XJ64_9PSED|nr:hypothetical protein [Pseudomonas cavernicola]RJG12512.1 hypothetical protein D3879_04280 [Pseudomonas cavernicola]